MLVLLLGHRAAAQVSLGLPPRREVCTLHLSRESPAHQGQSLCPVQQLLCAPRIANCRVTRYCKSSLYVLLVFSSAQSLSRVRLFATPRIAARQASLSITNSRSPLKLMSIEWVMPSSHLILCRPLLLLPLISPSIRRIVLLKLIAYEKQSFISFFSVASHDSLFLKNLPVMVTYLKTPE